MKNWEYSYLFIFIFIHMYRDSKNNLTVYIFRLLYTNKDIIRNLIIILAICLIFLTICLITSMILIQKRIHETDEYNYNYTEYDFGNHLGQHKVYYRKDWGGKPPKNNTVPLKHPVNLVIISHTETLPCNFTDQCCSTLRDIQMKHFTKPLRTVDIGYNFIIGGDGNIFVGRGWDVQNFHKKISIGISFIGNFDFDSVTPDMIGAAKDLVRRGLELRKISEDYVLVGENQTNPKMYLSPGREIYNVIKEWPHFYNNTMF